MEVWNTEEEQERQLPFACFLHRIPFLNKQDRLRLLTAFESCEKICRAEKREIQKVLGEKKAEKFLSCKTEENIWIFYEEMKRKGIKFVCRQSPDFPERLRDIPDAPFGIYVLGQLPGQQEKSVALIGARNCSGYGAHMAAELGKELARAGVQVISGMAKGIDGISQQSALNAGGKSFAVLGSGVDVCYPASNRTLYSRLKEAGGILSEYPPGTVPRPERFPPRNRIISGLADTVIVVEAREKSGTLITVDMALEQGREIYCLPGRTTDKLSEGCNRLIAQGAGIFVSVEDFLERSGMGKSGTAKEGEDEKEQSLKRQLGEKGYALWKLLDYDMVSLEQLYIQLTAEKGMGQISRGEMTELLTGLLILGKAENVSGCYYRKKG